LTENVKEDYSFEFDRLRVGLSMMAVGKREIGSGGGKMSLNNEQMIEGFEYKGIWWLPDKPEEQVSGTLRFTLDEGTISTLIGPFKDTKDMNKTLEPETILGVSSDGKNITL